MKIRLEWKFDERSNLHNLILTLDMKNKENQEKDISIVLPPFEQ